MRRLEANDRFCISIEPLGGAIARDIIIICAVGEFDTEIPILSWDREDLGDSIFYSSSVTLCSGEFLKFINFDTFWTPTQPHRLGITALTDIATFSQSRRTV